MLRLPVWAFGKGRLGAFWLLSEMAFWIAVATDGFSKVKSGIITASNRDIDKSICFGELLCD